jgi:hypothetical protein
MRSDGSLKRSLTLIALIVISVLAAGPVYAASESEETFAFLSQTILEHSHLTHTNHGIPIDMMRSIERRNNDVCQARINRAVKWGGKNGHIFIRGETDFSFTDVGEGDISVERRTHNLKSFYYVIIRQEVEFATYSAFKDTGAYHFTGGYLDDQFAVSRVYIIVNDEHDVAEKIAAAMRRMTELCLPI